MCIRDRDNRGVAIYARKSRITNKGDSIGVQFKQCADYAKKELVLAVSYTHLDVYKRQLQKSVSHYTLDENGSDRLMLKYYEYLLKIKYIQSAAPQILSDLSRLFGQKSGGF